MCYLRPQLVPLVREILLNIFQLNGRSLVSYWCCIEKTVSAVATVYI